MPFESRVPSDNAEFGARTSDDPLTVHSMDDTRSRINRQHGSAFAVAASSFTAPLIIALGYYVGATLGFALTWPPFRCRRYGRRTRSSSPDWC